MSLRVISEWTGAVRWGRSRAHTAYDRHWTRIELGRTFRGMNGTAETTRLSDAGLREVMERAERSMNNDIAPGEGHLRYDTRPNLQAGAANATKMLTPKLWSDATYAFDGEQRGAAIRQLLEPAVAAGYLAAGELRVQAKSYARFTTDGSPARYYPVTRVAFSTTVRDVKGSGSGWAGTDDFDVSRVDLAALSQRALQKCKTSINPVAVEPGRYTTILEPQAVADLFSVVSGGMNDWFWRKPAEQDHRGPFVGKTDIKIGQRVLDTRLSVSADPMDPVGGFVPFDQYQSGAPYVPVTWIDKGVLRELAYPRFYGLAMMGRTNEILSSGSWRISGGTTPVEEMIATTKRGLLVTRFHNVVERDASSLTCTGFTRDGMWLIQDGKISKPVKNFRFTESPLFAFNRVDQIGPVQRVFSEGNMFSEGRDLIQIGRASCRERV